MGYNSKYKSSEIEEILDSVGGKQDNLISGTNIKTINGESILGSGDLTIEGGAKIYEWFYDGESESVTLSQEEYDNIVEADIVVVNLGGLFSVIVSKTSKEVSEIAGRYTLIGQLELESEGIKLYININIEISTKVATITTEEQEILTKISQLENDSNFITSEDVSAVALSGSYNDLHDTPTIPSAVTESTVSGWGFTKNTGTYSKPSGGIPKTDLASAVQTSLGKADTALQSYTEQYKGTVTGVKINGSTKNPSSGVVDLGTVITSHQDISGKQDKLVSGTNIKTINGESILGSGDITIEGGSGGGGAGVYITPFTVEQFCSGYVEFTDEQRNKLINAASQNRIIGMPYDSNNQTGYIVADYNYSLSEFDYDFWALRLEVIYNGAHYSNSISSTGNPNFTYTRMTITPFKPLMYSVTAEDGVAYVYDDSGYTDNCIFLVEGECTELYVYLEPSEIGKTVRFFTGESCTFEFGFPVYWANGEVPTIEPYTYYELSLVTNHEFAFNAVLTPFKAVE